MPGHIMRCFRAAGGWLRRRWRGCLAGLAIGACALILLGLVTIAVAWQVSPFPRERLTALSASPVVTDRHGRVLLARTNTVGDWRLPVPLERMSPWLVRATIAVEDERFQSHIGVDAIAVCRAAWQNTAAMRVVSGASTLTMQLCNLLEPRPRSTRGKLTQAFRALQLERLLSKDEILAEYLNLAPYGGNLRGVEAASRAYFNKSAHDLSLGEAALLAGLPQAPARYRPDRHPQTAARRRTTVLRRMRTLGLIDARQEALAAAEPIDVKQRPLWSGLVPPRTAPHAAALALQQRPDGGQTTIDIDLQCEVHAIAKNHASPQLPADADVAIVVIEIVSGDIVALIGSANFADPRDGQVNGAVACRSPGSALKPLIYAAAFEAGALAPDSTVHDLPIRRGGWTPQNFNRQFAGPLPAAEALRRSLNVPAILVAEGVGPNRCLGLIESAGIHVPPAAASRTGLALAVGALETTLLDLTNAYATIGRGGLRLPARLLIDESATASPVRAIEPNICAALDEILSARKRTPRGLDRAISQPDQPARLPWFMWKTGTSAGRRDAWAIGHNRRYAIGVWVGRFAGPGHPAFLGSEAAEPLLAALFAHPRLRSDADPPPAAPWMVHRPLPPPREAQEQLRIIAPGDGSTLFALDGSAIVRPRLAGTTQSAAVSWFLNGRALPAAEAGRLLLPPAQYELRCVSAQGESSAVRFAVRAGQ